MSREGMSTQICLKGEKSMGRSGVEGGGTE